MSKGFTLTEVLVTVVVMGVLLAIALPSFLSWTGNAKESEAKQNLKALLSSQKVYRDENSSFATEDLTILGTVNNKAQNYYEYGVDPITNKDGVFLRATPKVHWGKDINSYFAAIVVFNSGGEPIAVSMICESIKPINGHLQKSDMYVDTKNFTLVCRNNARPIK